MKREEYEARKERQKQYYAGDSWNADSLKRTLKIIENTFIGQMNHLGFECTDGYEFRDENGNVINAQTIVLKKKKPKYPKTYKECLEGLDYKTVEDAVQIPMLLSRLERLLVCRDAYWKIAGEKMGLGKPWEHDWERGSIDYVICNAGGKIILTDIPNSAYNHILTFPTEEMRDAFFENFKELIEECKELL